MPKGKTVRLRIYCICGQKMKVSPSMYGRPGKCVACRQKIRIPKEEEIPPGTRELHLKDHPEFLRKPAVPLQLPQEPAPHPPSPPASLVAVAPPARNNQALPAIEPDADAAEPERVESPPIGVLEPLRTLCSLARKVDRELNALEDLEGEDGAARVALGRAELAGCRARIRRAHAALDASLRQRLMETAIDLASTQEKLGEARLAARVGEMDFQTYRVAVDKLRRRRDLLEERQLDIRAWLAVHDPHLAGGYIDVPLQRIPPEDISIKFEKPPESSESLVEAHVRSLRDALQRRERATRKLSEVERLASSPEAPTLGLEDLRADCKAQMRRAQAGVAFYRGRLEALQLDFESDLQTVEAQLDLARGRLQVGDIDRMRYSQLESELVQARLDASKTVELAKRALSAPSALDMPQPHGTFLLRMQPAKALWPPAFDSVLLWGAAALLFLSLFVPVLGDLSPLEAYRRMGGAAPITLWLLAVPIVLGVLLAMAGAVPLRMFRGLLAAGLWFVGWLALVTYLHEAQYDISPAGRHFQQGAQWSTRLGILLWSLSTATALAAALLALLPIRKARLLLAGLVVAGAAGTALIVTDGFGQFLPVPELGAATTLAQPPGEPGRPPTGVVLANTGGRQLLLSPTSTSRSAYRYLLEQQDKTGAWRDSGAALKAVEVDGLRTKLAAIREGLPDVVVAPGAQATLIYDLPPGTYRMRLSAVSGGAEHETQFDVGGPKPAAEPAEADTGTQPGADMPQGASNGASESTMSAAAGDAAAGQTGPGRTPEPSGLPTVDAELRGILGAADREPQFYIFLHIPGSEPKKLKVPPGSTIYGEWKLTEYNPATQTVTISNGSDIVVLRSRERVPLAVLD